MCTCVSPEVYEGVAELSLGGLSARRPEESVYMPSALCMSGEHVRGICGWTHEYMVFFVCVSHVVPAGKTRGVLIDMLGRKPAALVAVARVPVRPSWQTI